MDATGLAGSAGVFASNVGLGYGVNAQGVTGTVSRPNVPGGLGLLASDNNLGGSTLALMAQGASVFNGPVQFNGAVSDGQIHGDVTLGSATSHHQGPINLAQFGTGRFHATRTALA